MENNQTSPCCDKHRSLFKDFVGDLKCKYVTAIDKETREEYSIYILNLLITFNVQCNGKTFTYGQDIIALKWKEKRLQLHKKHPSRRNIWKIMNYYLVVIIIMICL